MGALSAVESVCFLALLGLLCTRVRVGIGDFRCISLDTYDRAVREGHEWDDAQRDRGGVACTLLVCTLCCNHCFFHIPYPSGRTNVKGIVRSFGQRFLLVLGLLS